MLFEESLHAANCSSRSFFLATELIFYETNYSKIVSLRPQILHKFEVETLSNFLTI